MENNNIEIVINSSTPKNAIEKGVDYTANEDNTRVNTLARTSDNTLRNSVPNRTLKSILVPTVYGTRASLLSTNSFPLTGIKIVKKPESKKNNSSSGTDSFSSHSSIREDVIKDLPFLKKLNSRNLNRQASLVGIEIRDKRRNSSIAIDRPVLRVKNYKILDQEAGHRLEKKYAMNQYPKDKSSFITLTKDMVKIFLEKCNHFKNIVLDSYKIEKIFDRIPHKDRIHFNIMLESAISYIDEIAKKLYKGYEDILSDVLMSPLEINRIILEVFSEFEALSTNLKIIRAMYPYLKECVEQFGIISRTKLIANQKLYIEIVNLINVGRFKIGKILEIMKLWDVTYIQKSERTSQSLFSLKKDIKDLEKDQSKLNNPIEKQKLSRKISGIKDSIKLIYITNKINYGFKDSSNVNYTDSNKLQEKNIETLNYILLNRKEIEMKEKYYHNREKIRLENLLAPYKNSYLKKSLAQVKPTLIKAIKTSLSFNNKPLNKEVSDYLKEQKIQIY